MTLSRVSMSQKTLSSSLTTSRSIPAIKLRPCIQCNSETIQNSKSNNRNNLGGGGSRWLFNVRLYVQAQVKRFPRIPFVDPSVALMMQGLFWLILFLFQEKYYTRSIVKYWNVIQKRNINMKSKRLFATNWLYLFRTKLKGITSWFQWVLNWRPFGWESDVLPQHHMPRLGDYLRLKNKNRTLINLPDSSRYVCCCGRQPVGRWREQSAWR